jgi:hypothetical protein
MIFLVTKSIIICLGYFTMPVKLKGKCRDDVCKQGLTFLHVELHGRLGVALPQPVDHQLRHRHQHPPTATKRSQHLRPFCAAEVAEKPTKSASSVASTSRTRDVHCHQCKGFGHMQCDCPSKVVLVVKADGEYSSASDFDEDTLALLAANNIASEDEEHIGADVADQYESLIVQRVLSAQMGKVEQNQRHNLFQTKCVVHKRSCCTIIDGGSCTNLVSTEMVMKLALQTKPHPHPYYIQWFNNSGRIKVTQLVRLNFAIGSYCDFVDCDVVPMHACSLLLGRPWQYDKDTLHHGRTNQYSFMHNGKKIVLHPMTPEAVF